MTETVKSIAIWAAETFGPAQSDARLLARANEEMAELVAQYLTPRIEMAACVTEAADVVIVLCRQAHRDRIFLQDIIKAARPMLVDGTSSVGRANTALAKALRAVTAGATGDAIALPIMDCVRWLAIFAEIHGQNLWTEIEAKMTINRARVWQVEGNGVGYHVRDKATIQPDLIVAAQDEDDAHEPCHRCGGAGELVGMISRECQPCHHCNGTGEAR